MSGNKLRLLVIVGSVRGGRLAPTVGNWFVAETEKFGEFEIDVLDLADVDLPLAMPSYGDEPAPEVRAVKDPLTARVVAADAYVVVTPEYNHSFPAALKNMIDWHLTEWAAKPVGFVSYGGVSGGLRATEHLRGVFAELNTVTVRETVSFTDAWGHWDHSGNWPKEPEPCNEAAKKLLVQLHWWAEVLAEAKERMPFPV
ncbi:NADPH-dependent FMN reductase [Actinomadura terrae]|uniref:NADPH-dependent FMN reductase n=1 Tax=Actinomadura terrae TaxID=604353 RepID=UPI001FA76A19|nr:NAD(P)H-dependent oxidoreductase [Actinomadura terrae]